METYTFLIMAEDDATANRRADEFSYFLGGVGGVTRVTRIRLSPDSMDIGTVIEAVADSGAALAIARGIFRWLASKRHVDVKLHVRKDSKEESITLAIKGADSKTAICIIRTLLQRRCGGDDGGKAPPEG